jgi:hypothetical protein
MFKNRQDFLEVNCFYCDKEMNPESRQQIRYIEKQSDGRWPHFVNWNTSQKKGIGFCPECCKENKIIGHIDVPDGVRLLSAFEFWTQKILWVLPRLPTWLPITIYYKIEAYFQRREILNGDYPKIVKDFFK